MKQLIFIYLLGSMTIGQGQLRIGFDITGESFGEKIADKFYISNKYIDKTIIGTKSVHPIIIGYDIFNQKDKLYYGLGIELISNRGAKEFSNGKVAFHSIYGVSKYEIYKKIFGIIKVGLNFHSGNNAWVECYECDIYLYDGLVYAYGIGLGELEITLITNNASMRIDLNDNSFFDDQAFDIIYRRFNVSLIMNFKLDDEIK